MLRMTSRTLGATLGVLASLACTAYILVRLHQAGQPAPTQLQLRNATGAALSVDEVALAAQRLPGTPFTLDASAALQVAQPQPLPPGRPVSVSLRAGPAAASCRLDPRPQGVCVVHAVFSGAAELQCAYDCKPSPPPAQ